MPIKSKMSVLSSVLSVMFVITTLALADYTENFDTAENWYGNVSSFDNPAYYTNNTVLPANDKFSSNYANRENTNYRSSPYAWRIATYANTYFRYECQTTVSNFSFWLARESGFDPPDIKIRYSNNSGATWHNIYHGDTFFNGVSDLTYTQYVSPKLDVTPRPNQKIYIEVYKFSGARFLVDDFALNHYPIETNTAFMVYPAPAVTGIVGQVEEFFSDSYSNGVAQIGYGHSSNNVGWTWLSTGETNISGGYGATNSFWLMPGKWFYAARWIRDNGAVTNYAWNDHGQTNASSLVSAQYFYFVTSSVHSVIWDFGYPNDTSPTQGTGSISFSQGLSSNWLGNSTLEVSGFTTNQAPQISTNIIFSTDSIGKQNVGFFFSVARDQNGPKKINIEYNADNSGWSSFISNYDIPQTGCWFMVGKSGNGAFDLKNSLEFRISAYDANSLSGKIFFDEVLVHAPVPEPGIFIILSFIIPYWLIRQSSQIFPIAPITPMAHN